ncbi:MAG: PqqD family protein [Candidatus Omnitrophica bacterium]|nr:PqqD family protein [Candidatus Omnitrophota bacterium]
MEKQERVSLDAIYAPSQDVLAKEIQGELVIIPITAGTVDLENEFFKLNGTSKAVWDKLNGRKTLRELAGELQLQFAAPVKPIERDLLELVEELLRRRMLVAVNRT